MIILSIETSCDETAISLLQISGKKNNPKIKILGNSLHSQIKIHEQYGGVFPNMARREHQKNLTSILLKVLKESGFLESRIKNTELSKSKIQDSRFNIQKILEREPLLLEQIETHIINLKKPPIDLIAVTEGPGLEPALWVGINFAKAIGELWNIPVTGINHMEGHILSILPMESGRLKVENGKKNKTSIHSPLSTINFPAIALLVSGGHTELVLMKKFLDYQIIGKTRDDAVGEAFDKVARILNLSYPGGPEISRLASKARSQKLIADFSLPRPMIHSKNFEFSFSGLKTAVLYLVRDMKDVSASDKEKIAREFEDSVADVLELKTKNAILKYKAKSLIVGGGVSANVTLQKRLKTLAKSLKINLHFPGKNLSTDNAIMIGISAFCNYSKSKNPKKEIVAKGNLSL